MDFITRLLILKGCSNIVIITNRLSKGVIANRLLDIEVEIVIKWFLCYYYPYYFLLRAIIFNKEI